MAESLILDWLNENAQRAYPLVETSSRTSDTLYKLPNGAIIDAQLRYSADTSLATLDSIENDGVDITVNTTGHEFVIPIAGPYPYYARSSGGSLLVVNAIIAEAPLGVHVFTSVKFEQSVIYEFAGAWLGVQSVTFENDTPTALTGEITLLEGYQFNIVAAHEALALAANSIYGVPISCGTFGNLPNNCDEVLSYISGVGPDALRKFTIKAGPGVTVLDDPANYRIYVGLSFDPKDVCKDIPLNPEI